MSRIHRIRRTVFSLAVLAACGTNDPNPPPIVTAVAVTPPSAPLFPGDTLLLTATVKDQHGTELTGKTVTWSSSPLTVANVLANGRVVAISAGTATITAAVEGKSGTAAIIVVPSVTLEPARAVSKTIGSEGGTITVTSAAGVTYDFVVPPLALDSSVRITVTPISGIAGLPFSQKLAGAVEFQPSGLKFGAGVRLVIKPSAPLPALGPTQRLIGFTTDDNGKALGVQTAVPVTGGLAIVLAHFTTGGLAIAEVADLTTLPSTPDGSAMMRRLPEILTASLSPDPVNAVVAVFRAWRAEIEPLINLAQTGTDAKIAIDLFLNWEEILDSYEDPAMNSALAGDRAALATATQLAMKRGIAALNQQCVQIHNLVDAKNVLYLQQYAEVFSTSLTGIGSGLSQQAVLATLCIQSIQSFARFQDFTGNSSAALDLTYGVKFGSESALNGAFFDVTLSVSGAASNGTQTIRTNAAGQLPQTLIATGTTPITIQVKACLGSSQVTATVNLQALGIVCHFATLTANPASPVITPATLPNGHIDAAYSQTLQATGGIGSYQWSVSESALPPGLVLNPATGAITGTPETTGAFSFTIRVTSGSQFHERVFLITVNPSVEVLSIGGAVVQTSAPGSVLANARESNSTVLLFRERATRLANQTSVDISLPGTYRTSLAPGTIPANTDVVSYLLHVDPVGSPSSDITYQGGVTFTREILGFIPTALTLDATDGILGAPGTAYPTGNSERGAGIDPGSTDADQITLSADRRTLTLTLQARAIGQVRIVLKALAITPATLPSGRVGEVYSQTLIGTGGTASYAWSTSQETLPPGLALDVSAGSITGTPTVAGTYPFTVRVTSGGVSADQSLSITVAQFSGQAFAWSEPQRLDIRFWAWQVSPTVWCFELGPVAGHSEDCVNASGGGQWRGTLTNGTISGDRVTVGEVRRIQGQITGSNLSMEIFTGGSVQQWNGIQVFP